MTRLQEGLTWRFKEAIDPSGGMPHGLGRVIRVNRKLHTVDVALRYGGTLINVKVLKDVAGTNEGSGWLPDVDAGKTEDATPTFQGTGTNDTYCVVGYIEGRQREPYVAGFVPPPQFETSFEKMNVTKFHNGMYQLVDDDGIEWHRPDGTFFRLGATNTSADLTALNASKDVPFDPGAGTAKPAASVSMGNGAGAKSELKADGGIQMTTPSNVQVTDSTGTFTLASPAGVPADVTKAAAAAGSSASSSRSDHKHDISTASASANVTKAAAAEGTATSLARSDHKHDATTATAGASAPADTAAEGTATSLARSDHRHSREATTALATVTTDGLISHDDQKRMTTQSLGNITGAVTFDLSLGDTIFATLTGNISITLTNPLSHHDYLFELVQDGTGSRTVTWTTTVKWQGGSTPVATTTLNKKDLFLLHRDTADYLGTATLNF